MLNYDTSFFLSILPPSTPFSNFRSAKRATQSHPLSCPCWTVRSAQSYQIFVSPDCFARASSPLSSTDNAKKKERKRKDMDGNGSNCLQLGSEIGDYWGLKCVKKQWAILTEIFRVTSSSQKVSFTHFPRSFFFKWDFFKHCWPTFQGFFLPSALFSWAIMYTRLLSCNSLSSGPKYKT